MNTIKYIGLLLLAIWLLLQGIKGFFEFSLPIGDKILAGTNLLAGLILAGYWIKLKHGNLGLCLLGLWLLFNNFLFLFHFSFSHSNEIAHALGIIAGILLILKV